MIRLTTTQARAAELKRYRMAVARQCADAIEALPCEVCAHNDRPSCPRCATRLAIQAAARVVRQTGGVT
jgi:hypothetical protein